MCVLFVIFKYDYIYIFISVCLSIYIYLFQRRKRRKTLFLVFILLSILFELLEYLSWLSFGLLALANGISTHSIISFSISMQWFGLVQREIGIFSHITSISYPYPYPYTCISLSQWNNVSRCNSHELTVHINNKTKYTHSLTHSLIHSFTQY